MEYNFFRSESAITYLKSILLQDYTFTHKKNEKQLNTLDQLTKWKFNKIFIVSNMLLSILKRELDFCEEKKKRSPRNCNKGKTKRYSSCFATA